MQEVSFPKEISLLGRDCRYTLKFSKHISEDHAEYVFDDNPMLEYIRVSYSNDLTIDFIDPPGGPILKTGDTIVRNGVSYEISIISKPQIVIILKLQK